MPAILNTVALVAARLSGRRVTFRFTMDAQIAEYVAPLIEMLIADTNDGDTYRNPIADWRSAERPPICIHSAEISTVRIDGPWQKAGDTFLPLGGLLLSPGVTAHLNPIEADALYRLIRKAIEREILEWIARHKLQYSRPVPAEIDRATADPAARELIARWVMSRQVLEMVGMADRCDRRQGP